ncbi:VOC family protein [Corticibacterium sp. UT-5YL-CI-8]|nr:VOC family protein [Tianweitania sp. UT-5YL-CI-8]
MSTVATCLWFDQQAQEAAEFYISVFKSLGRRAEIGKISHYGENAPMPAGTVLTVTLSLDGQHFTLLNGGPHFQLSSAVSVVVNCADQAELDAFWSSLGDGGKEVQCGWLTDRYGLSWQVVPAAMDEWMSGDPAAASRVMAAFMPMIKLDIATLERAYRGE